MPMRCVALLSGGLDSQLAVRIMQSQGIEVEAVNFKTAFTCCQDQAGQAARMLGVPLTVLAPQDDYLDLIRRPRFGYGKGANPCIDCRIYMFQKARQFMQQIDAQFIVSGELVGQRPMSQKKRDLLVISRHSDLDDLLLRPLSARCLPPTLPERAGWVRRDDLYAFTGRSRKGLIQLAQRFGLPDIPAPSNGCALTEPRFARKVFDLVDLHPQASAWDFELLKHGRHFRFSGEQKVVVGRHEAENQHLVLMHSQPDARSSALLEPDNFNGPITLLVGPLVPEALQYAADLLARYGASHQASRPRIRASHAAGTEWLEPRPTSEPLNVPTIAGQ